MTVRTIGVTAAIGMIVSVSAQADPPGGDIVDQILHPPPPTAAAPSLAPFAQPGPPAVLPPSAAPAPVVVAQPMPPAVAAQPMPLTPQNTIVPATMPPTAPPPPRPVLTPLQPASTLTGPDIIGDAQPAIPLP